MSPVINRRIGAPFRVVAALVAIAAQLVLCSATVLEARFGPDAQSHVEANGTRLHHAHNDTDCAACTACHLLATSQRAVSERLGHPGSTSVLRADDQQVLRGAHRLHARSRAPPSIPA